MRKIPLYFLFVISLIYLGIHLLLASDPFQKKILLALKQGLLKEGIEVQIQSVDFSLFSPKLYLNRVSLQGAQGTWLELEHPLEVDKIKIELQLFGLFFKEIVFQEVVLYHPKIIVPQADALYRKIENQLNKRGPIKVKGSGWPVIFKRIGVVDSQFEVSAQQPEFSFRSRNLSVFLSQTAVGQQSVEVTSNHFEFRRGALEVVLRELDCDVDFTGQSVRANRLILEGEGVKLNWKGAFSIPSQDNNSSLSFHLSHETELNLAFLTKVPELSLPEVGGVLKSNGTLHVNKGNYLGSGNVELKNTSVKKIHPGDLEFSYQAEEKEIKLRNFNIQIAEGNAKADSVKIAVSSIPELSASFEMKNIDFQALWLALDLNRIPVFGEMSGVVQINGKGGKDWGVSVEPEVEIRKMVVVNNPSKKTDAKNQIVAIPTLNLKGKSEFRKDRDLQAQLEGKLLGGQLKISGEVDKGVGQFKFNTESIDLKQLGAIAQIPFEGDTDIEGELLVRPGADIDIVGDFSIQKASISEIDLGSVRGKLQYRKELLSFSKLELKALESAKGQGFVDFSPKDTVYRFDVSAPRIALDQVWDLFKKNPLPLQKPEGGELGAKVLIEGGETSPFSLKATGQVRNFEWYGEKWMSASVGIDYQPGSFQVEKGVFLKRSGSLEVKAVIGEKKQELQFYTSGLRLEDLNWLRSSPLQGEITGRLVFEGPFDVPQGNGELLFSKLEYRGQKIADAKFSMRSERNSNDFMLSIPSEGFDFRWTQGLKPKVLLKARKTELAPYLSAFMGKEISPLNNIKISADGELAGELNNLNSLSGDLMLRELILDFSGRRISHSKDTKIRFDVGEVDFPELFLKGSETELAMSFSLKSREALKASLKGTVPLELLQPFIPGVDFASGGVTADIQASGPPDRYQLFGAILLNDASFRISGMQDDFRAVQARLSLSPRELKFEKFLSRLGGGEVAISGNVGLDRFSKFYPNLSIKVSKSTLQLMPYLKATMTGDLVLKGEKTPYLLSGNIQLDDFLLTSLSPEISRSNGVKQEPVLAFNIGARAEKGLFIKTEILNGEFSGAVTVVGDDQRLGLLGKADVVKGQLFFKDTPFDIITGGVKFEKSDAVYPRFNLNARSVVREQKGRAYQDYEVNLQALGTPEEYKIRLTSNPPLAEQDLISLLVLGVTTQGQEGNYFDLGTAIMGQSPIRSKIQSELGVDIKVQSAPGQGPMPSDTGAPVPGAGVPGSTGSGMVPAFRIEKGISRSTKLSYSNTLDQNQARELRVEQMLDDNITLNATAGDRSRNNTQARPGDSFGLDLRYRFTFD